MSHYKHLSIEERESLFLFKAQGKSIRAIARELNRAPSTISRELRRTKSGHRPYRPSAAQARYERNRKRCGRKHVLRQPAAQQLVRELVELQWSPEEISGRLKAENNTFQISFSSIYRAINAGIFDVSKELHKKDKFIYKLRKKGKRRKANNTERKQGKYEILRHIQDRPSGAQDRSEIGHWEGDTIIGKKGSARLVTLTDRCTRFLLAGKVADGSCETVKDEMIRLLSSVPKEKVKSVTPDRGHEFARYQDVEAVLPYAEFYFPPPYSPWERGTNENTNGLLREYFPKYTDIAPASEETVNAAVARLNMRPRKCLNWKSPYEVFFGEVLHLT